MEHLHRYRQFSLHVLRIVEIYTAIILNGPFVNKHVSKMVDAQLASYSSLKIVKVIVKIAIKDITSQKHGSPWYLQIQLMLNYYLYLLLNKDRNVKIIQS